MASKCLDCGKGVTARSKAVQCSLCDGWLHIACCDISPDLYDYLQRTTSSAISFHCDSCRTVLSDRRVLNLVHALSPRSIPTQTENCTSAKPPVSSSPRSASDSASSTGKRSRVPSSSLSEPLTLSDGSHESRRKTYAAVVSENVEQASASTCAALRAKKTKSDSTTKPKKSSELKLVLDRVSQLENVLKNSMPPMSQPTEYNKPHSRDRCLIIMNAPESNKGSPAERILDDQEFLRRMVSLLFDEGEQGINIVSAFRLGRKQDDSSKVRPLKIVCQSEDECRRILRRTPRLRGETFYVLRDLCPEDRIRMKKAVEELRARRENGEMNLHIVDFRVVQKAPRIRWRPIFVAPGR
ncbi:unnamed protein product [Dicrocoelium dendriticum]|nr:unnamed protein product [Dicrocoelium dendriticum]